MKMQYRKLCKRKLCIFDYDDLFFPLHRNTK